ncbi:DUF4118 domain-containing protein [Dictyobacter kobayashii]|uniref:PAC domain-containing protein n=1 Tax=Dictyobacter kobayashii TaxID=2014872 RepID=A0A402AUD4_9CHLR|nr:DUF4118 domain-containing protein [Dictyobacter kobayashii]GCE22643.1 hypothetical protein KDK_64430 [Dictyobacter kobayashii]
MSAEQHFPGEQEREPSLATSNTSSFPPLGPHAKYKNLWDNPRLRWRSHTFAPAFLPVALQKPEAGYLVALLSQMLVVMLMTLLMRYSAHFRFLEAPTLLVVLLVALGWGVLPGLLATLIGSGWIIYLALPIYIPYSGSYTEDLASVCFYLIVSITICVVASQTQRGRLRAEQLALRLLSSEREAAERANQLEVVYEAMIDGVIIYDSEGHILRMNSAYRHMVALDTNPAHAALTPEQRGTMLRIRDEKGVPLNGPQMPVQRTLSGETFTAERAMDIRVRALDGREVQFNITGSPLYNSVGKLTGGVLIFRDVTERRHLERKTQQALESLLLLAEELVQMPAVASNLSNSRLFASTTVAHRLLEHICLISGCTRIGLMLVNQTTGVVFPLAALGLSADLERNWLDQRQDYPVEQLLQTPVIGPILRAHDVGVLDFTQPQLSHLANPYGISQAVVAPMYIESRLIGFLFLDHGGRHILIQRLSWL